MPDEIRKIYNILVFILGESKNGFEVGNFQYQFPCPRCVERDGITEIHKFNLEVNIKSQLFNCWSCSSIDEEMKGRIAKLIKLYGNTQLYREYMECLKSLRDNKLYSLDFNKEQESLIPDEVDLPHGYRPFRHDKFYPTDGFEYLTKRGIDWDIINEHEIGFITHNDDSKLCNRIILPSRDEFGSINYWTGRDYTGNDKRQKYMNPKVDRKDIVFDEEKVQWDADITLVEGPFDHIVVPNSIPLLGKSLNTDYKLYWSIQQRCNGHINIWLDADAFESTKTLYKLLNHGRLYGKIRYIPSEGEYDPSLIFEKGGRKAVVEYLKAARRIPEHLL